MELKQSMSDMITRCPKCHTSFRITPAQLQTAKGSVRCGSCLHIFKAMDHLVQGKKEVTPKAATSNKQAPPRKSDAEQTAQVRPLPVSPKFEYRKPSPPPVSTKDIEKALRSSIDAAPVVPKPRPAPPPSPPPRESKLNEFGIPDDILDEDFKPATGFGDDEGQQNMLVFDQSAIDEDGETALPEEDDLLISDDMSLGDDGEIVPKKTAYGDDLAESFLDLDNWAPKETSLFDRKSKPPKEEEDSDDRHAPDESWAIDLLEEDDGEEQIAFSGVHRALDELDLEMEEPDYEPPNHEYSRATTGSFNALDDNDIEDALGAPLDEHIEPKFDESRPVTEDEFYPEFARDNKDDYDEDSYGDEDYGSEYGGGDFMSDEYSREERKALLKGIKPAPVEFTNYNHRHNWRKTAIWGGAITVALLVLVAQVAWLQFNTLSRQQPYRSLYGLLGIDVPPMSAPNMIRASNLVVRSHPNADNALMVDTILLNTAPFTQPFPDLVLNFSDVQGKTLAARRFKPKEYLGGELAGRSQMPIGQPVHLTLEIVDPGPDAVSYSAYIPN